jgi:hypothetical protein
MPDSVLSPQLNTYTDAGLNVPVSDSMLNVSPRAELEFGNNSLLNIQRLPEHLEKYYEIKDPSVVILPNGNFMMFASIGNSVRQEWQVGRFISDSPTGTWKEVPPVIFENLSGPQLCAPAVTYEEKNGQPLWKMYIQTACFEEDGVIALATSNDGHVFTGQATTVATKSSVKNNPAPVVGVYDVGVSEIMHGQEELLCMIYSGYRKVGCGDLYISFRKKHEPEESWSAAECLLTQEQVPFHNSPDYSDYEWGLEGAKLVQLSSTCFLLIGVCFMPMPREHLGNKQRVFLAVADNHQGPFTPLCTPFAPQKNEWNTGENGHPDTLIVGNDLWIVYQERYGDGKPWHLRVAQVSLEKLERDLTTALGAKKLLPQTIIN